MNVAFDPWIPVVTSEGVPELASLCEVLTKGDRFADLSVRPHERVALMRLFLCVAHAALNGPKDYNEWREVPKKLPEAVRRYLKEWKESFELFHKKKPWLQITGLSKNQEEISKDDLSLWSPVSKLNFSLSTGNNTTFFDHAGMAINRSISISETLVSMITFQCFSPGGLISQVYWNNAQTGKSSKDGPCVSASMIHAFLRGENLLESLRLNLPSYDDIRSSYGNLGIGNPVWECPPGSFSDTAGIANATQTYIGRLVPMTRLILLHQAGSKMLLGDGLEYPPYSNGFPPEPSATVLIRKIAKKEERILLSYRPSRALWRELSAVVTKRAANGLGGPLSLCALQEGEECDLVVSALARDQATIVDTSESVFHIPAKLLSADGHIIYEEEVRNAETVAGRLGWAIEVYRTEIDGGWEGQLKSAGPAKGALKAKLHSLATVHYWTTVEKNLPLLMSHIAAIDTDAALPTRDAWRKMLFATACDAFRVACGCESPRRMRAFAKGFQRLLSEKKAESDTPEHKEVEA
jgi:CRISPR system Cascade subunit CasA